MDDSIVSSIQSTVKQTKKLSEQPQVQPKPVNLEINNVNLNKFGPAKPSGVKPWSELLDKKEHQ